MRKKPSGKDLLEIAREALQNELIPVLPKDQQYSALMIANAMAIVMRQIEADGLGSEVGSAEEQSRELAVRIRRGEADGADTWRNLHAAALIRVSESNPKYLRNVM
jgi:hypothetical protein